MSLGQDTCRHTALNRRGAGAGAGWCWRSAGAIFPPAWTAPPGYIRGRSGAARMPRPPRGGSGQPVGGSPARRRGAGRHRRWAEPARESSLHPKRCAQRRRRSPATSSNSSELDCPDAVIRVMSQGAHHDGLQKSYLRHGHGQFGECFIIEDGTWLAVVRPDRRQRELGEPDRGLRELGYSPPRSTPSPWSSLTSRPSRPIRLSRSPGSSQSGRPAPSNVTWFNDSSCDSSPEPRTYGSRSRLSTEIVWKTWG